MSENFDVNIIVHEDVNWEYSREFNDFFHVTFDTSISELKNKLDEFFKTKGQQITFFEAGRDGTVFSDDMNAKLENFKDNYILSPDKHGKNKYFNVALDIEPLKASGGKRRRRTFKKRKVVRKRRTNKKRKVYRRK